MSNDLHQFLEPAPGIQCEHPQVQALVQGIVKGAADEMEAAGRLFRHARDTVAYSPYVPYFRIKHYLALNVLERGHGFCVQKGALLVTLARAAGIPARLGFAHIRNHQMPETLRQVLGGNVMYNHCFAEFYLDGGWLKLTPTFDQALSQERGWQLVEFQPGQNALLPAEDLAGRPHISYLENLGWRLGVPLEELIETWRLNYGDDQFQRWDQAILDYGHYLPGEMDS